jgi:hypothetical protein
LVQAVSEGVRRALVAAGGPGVDLDRAGLAFEPGAAIGIVGEVGRQGLERDFAAGFGIFGDLDLSHSPLADPGQQLVVKDRRTDHPHPLELPQPANLLLDLSHDVPG